MIKPEIVLADDISHIVPEIYSRSIGFVTLDAENVLTDYKDPQVRPEARALVVELSSHGIATVLITNNSNTAKAQSNTWNNGYVDQVHAQLPELGQVYHPGLGYAKKPAADMFEAAVCDYGIDPKDAAHVDDQLKSWLGAHRVGYGTYIWTKPWGEHQHPGVLAVRPLEAVARFAITTSHAVGELKRGDW